MKYNTIQIEIRKNSNDNDAPLLQCNVCLVSSDLTAPLEITSLGWKTPQIPSGPCIFTNKGYNHP